MGWLVLAVVVVAFGLRASTAQGHAVTADEPRWMDRSAAFHQAVRHGDLASASATTTLNAEADATMPGVTTMWVGAAGQTAWSLAHDVGLVDDATGTFVSDPSGLDVAQTAMALAVSLVVGALTALVARWAGVVAAVVVGLLVATEPFFVAHGAVLHTDSLTSLLGMAALVATALALGVPRPTGWAGQWWAGGLAGALWGGALLTKLTALVFLPGAALLAAVAVAVAVASARRSGRSFGREDVWPLVAPLARTMAWWVAAAAVVTVALYPALWVAPAQEFSALRRTMGLASAGHSQFFLGEPVETPGPAFYAVALPLRMTPWFLAASVVAAVVAWRRATGRHALAVVAMAGPVLVALSLAGKQFDRYGLPLLVAAALLAGLAAEGTVSAMAESPVRDRRALVTATIGAAAAGLYSLSVVPWGLAYYNPALGGARTAVDTVLVGWWEGVEQAGPIIAERQRGNCEDVTIRGPDLPRLFPCGTLTSHPDADYVVLYVSQRQRSTPARLRAYTEGRQLVATIRERGIPYVEVYGPRRPEVAATGA